MKQFALRRKLGQWRRMNRKVCIEYTRPKRMLTKLKNPDEVEHNIYALKDEYSYVKLYSVDYNKGIVYEDYIYIVDVE